MRDNVARWNESSGSFTIKRWGRLQLTHAWWHVERLAKPRMKRLDYLPAGHLGTGDDASLEFVLIAESGVLERQALLLCESLRAFAGKYSQCPVTVVSPRASRRPSTETLRHLDKMGCAYLPLEIDSVEPEYGTTFRMYVSAEMENISKADVLVVMDSDLLFAAEPDLSLNGAAAALRPVDVAGICSEGPNDPRDAYWRALCQRVGVDYHAIPMIETTVEKAVVKACYNGGLAVASRKHRIFERALKYFQQSVAAGLAPSPGTPATIEAGHGVVAGRGSELWGSSQICLSLAIWGNGLWVKELPKSHNFPLHLVDKMSSEDQSHALSIIHYHSLLAGDHRRNPMLSGSVNVSPDFVEWLKARTIATA